MSFYIQNIEIIRIDGKGDFFYRGNYVSNDKDIPRLMRKYFNNALTVTKHN